MKSIEITPKTIWIFLGSLVGIYLAWLIKDILAVLFISLILIASFSPLVKRLTKYLKWRSLSVLVVYLIILALLVLIVAPVVPTLINQTNQIINDLPFYTQKLSWASGLKTQLSSIWQESGFSLSNLSEQISQSTSQLFQLTGSVASFFSYFLLIIIISFYGLATEEELKKWARNVLPKEEKEKYWKIGRKIYYKLGSWLRAQIILAIIVGLLVGSFLSILGIPYALLLGAIAGLFELVPVLGPVLAAIPALIISFALSPADGVLVLGWFLIIHFIESYILVPKIMQSALGLNPIIILIALLIGAKLGGVLGILISVPLIASIIIAIQQTGKKNS